VFCWGELGNNPNVNSYLKRLGVHGVIYDCIDVHLHQTRIKSKRKRGIFAGTGRSSSGRTRDYADDCGELPHVVKRRNSI
jgi:hypothetical protein